MALLAIAGAVLLIRVVRGDGLSLIDGLLIAGFGVGGYALIDPTLAKELLDKARSFRKNGGAS